MERIFTNQRKLKLILSTEWEQVMPFPLGHLFLNQ